MKWIHALSPIVSRKQPSAAVPPPQFEAESEFATQSSGLSRGKSCASKHSETDTYAGTNEASTRASGQASQAAAAMAPLSGGRAASFPTALATTSFAETPKVQRLTSAQVSQTIAELLPLLQSLTGHPLQTDAFSVKLRTTPQAMLQTVLLAQLFDSAPPDQHYDLYPTVQDLIAELPHSKFACVYVPSDKIMFVTDRGLSGKSIDKLRYELFMGLCLALIDQTYPAHTLGVTEARVACLRTQIFLGKGREPTPESRELYMQRATFDMAVARAWCAQAVTLLGDDLQWAGLRAQLATAAPSGLRAWRGATAYEKAWAKLLKEAFGQSAQFGQRFVDQLLSAPELQVLALQGKLARVPDEVDTL